MSNTVKVKSLENADWDRMSRVVGKIEAFGKMPADAEGKERAFMIVDSGTARFRVFESFALQELFAAATLSDGVDVLHLGKADLAQGRTIRRFRYTLYDGKDFDPARILAAISAESIVK